MTKQELSDILDITRPTLNKWEKEKPELVRLINQGMLFDKLIEDTEKQLEKLKLLKENANIGKFKLK